MFDLLKSKTKTEQGAAEQPTALTPVAAPQNVIAEITTDAAKQIVTSDATYKDKIETAISIAATKEALSNSKVQKTIIENKDRELKNKSTVEKINSETAINEGKSQRERVRFMSGISIFINSSALMKRYPVFSALWF